MLRKRSGVLMPPQTSVARHFCRIDAEGQPYCTCGWSEYGHFDSGGARFAEIHHLMEVGASWANLMADQR
jgi:hypothetical protein